MTVRVQVGDELYEIVCRHSTAKRIHEVATVCSAEMFEVLEPLARCIEW